MLIAFDFENGFSMCCGCGEIGSFVAQPDKAIYPIYHYYKVNSYDEIHKVIYKKVCEVLEDEDGVTEDGQYLLKAFVVDGTPQYWKDYFHNRRNWKRGHSFTNVKTGNTITEYSWLMKIKPSGNSDDDDDYWD